jgi:hypothetical protein
VLPQPLPLILGARGDLVCGRHIFGWHFPFRVAQLRDARERGGKLSPRQRWQAQSVALVRQHCIIDDVIESPLGFGLFSLKFA